MMIQKPIFTSSVFCLALGLAACGGGSGDGTEPPEPVEPEPVEGVQTRMIDATSSTSYVYFNLTDAEVVALTDAEAETSTDWHIAFRRFNVKLNGGSSGPGNGAAAMVAEPEGFYDENGAPNVSVFLNATPEQTLNILEQTFPEPDRRAWIVDRVSNDFSDQWYVYDIQTGIAGPNPDNGWLIRGASGQDYARLRVTDLIFDTRSGKGIESFRIAFDVQPQGTVQFTGSAVFEGGIPPEGGESCFNFIADATVECIGVDWDIKIGFAGRSFILQTNGGVSGPGQAGIFGPFDWTELSGYGSATIAPNGQSIAGRYNVETSTGIFSSSAWYEYALDGQPTLWPNYRVYLIDTDRDAEDAPRYALQIIGYYNDAGTSGNPTIRWRKVD